ncbi:MAG: aspartate ammonia-lyase [Clostridia bacterium]|nr:aspartate ammonia-lyase [Clostridia bacterium]NCC43085.1 aspartate ammonia-lyase [Clostridia bacterium]
MTDQIVVISVIYGGYVVEETRTPEYRVERDSIGKKDIPGDVYYGVQSLRAAENFHITGLAMHPEIINSLAYIKKAAAITNCEVGLLEKPITTAIVQACDEIIAGKFHEDFIVDPIQGGAGTSLNMNANEVIANRAIELLGGEKGDYSIVNPNDHVNYGQSTNDVIPTAGKMTSLRLLKNLKKELLRLHKALCEKAEEFDHVIKMGRTQMQDAVPIRLGQEFKAYSVAIMRDIHRMDKAMDEMRTLNMGGTAVGTGINADEGYLQHVVPNLNDVSDMEFVQAFDLIDATQNLDSFVAVSGSIKACAVTLSKIANDLRLMSSGPRAGFHEINLPAKQNGSSIMPGKVNPVIPEVVNQVAFNIIGNDMTITMAAEAGQLELNAFEPIIFYCMFQSIDTLAYAVHTFVDNCVSGITANETRCRYLVENSVGIITAICPHVGYQKAADIAKKALKTGESVRTLILEEKLLDEAQLDHILDPVNMTEPGISGKKLLFKSK